LYEWNLATFYFDNNNNQRFFEDGLSLVGFILKKLLHFEEERKIWVRYQRWIQKNILLWRKLFLARIKEELANPWVVKRK